MPNKFLFMAAVFVITKDYILWICHAWYTSYPTLSTFALSCLSFNFVTSVLHNLIKCVQYKFTQIVHRSKNKIYSQGLAAVYSRTLHNLPPPPPPRSEVGGSDEGRRSVAVNSEMMIRNKAIGETNMSACAGYLFRSRFGFDR